jgi:23S rRNA (cytosine1962-C5)-methyltransferase
VASPADTVDLSRLPVPNTTRVAVRVTADAARHIRAGHPWVYDESITSLGPAGHRGAPGDLAVIFRDDRSFMAIGLYDPTSPIRIKIIHRGKPTPIDAAFWTAKLHAACAVRAPLVAAGDTTGYRCVNGENDGFPGLVLDRYADTLVLKLYTPAWIPHLATLVPVIESVCRPDALVLRLARSMSGSPLHGLREGMALLGEVPSGPIMFREHWLHFEADVVHGQKTGHFLDQRDNRILVGEMIAAMAAESGGVRVLDVFAATGGFSVHAAAGGAAEVVSVDASAPTLAVAERNMAHNLDLPAVRSCRHSVLTGDAYEVMDRLRRARERFDVVVVDPPSFAQRQESIERALHAYGQLTERAVGLLREGGLLVQASCSSRVGADEFHAAVRAGVLRAGRDFKELRRTGHPLDHPVTFPQGAYLKATFARVT